MHNLFYYLSVLILIITGTLECCIDVKIGFQKLNKILFSKCTFRLFVIYPFLDYFLFIFTGAMIDIIPVKWPFPFLCCPVHHGSSHPSVTQSSLRASSSMSFFVGRHRALSVSSGCCWVFEWSQPNQVQYCLNFVWVVFSLFNTYVARWQIVKLCM